MHTIIEKEEAEPQNSWAAFPQRCECNNLGKKGMYSGKCRSLNKGTNLFHQKFSLSSTQKCLNFVPNTESIIRSFFLWLFLSLFLSKFFFFPRAIPELFSSDGSSRYWASAGVEGFFFYFSLQVFRGHVHWCTKLLLPALTFQKIWHE